MVSRPQLRPPTETQQSFPATAVVWIGADLVPLRSGCPVILQVWLGVERLVL
jgi:hypothetical protein